MQNEIDKQEFLASVGLFLKKSNLQTHPKIALQDADHLLKPSSLDRSSYNSVPTEDDNKSIKSDSSVLTAHTRKRKKFRKKKKIKLPKPFYSLLPFTLLEKQKFFYQNKQTPKITSTQPVSENNLNLNSSQKQQHIHENNIKSLKKTHYICFDYEKYCNRINNAKSNYKCKKYKSSKIQNRPNGQSNKKIMIRRNRFLKRLVKPCSVQIYKLSDDEIRNFNLSKESLDYLNSDLRSNKIKIEESNSSKKSLTTIKKQPKKKLGQDMVINHLLTSRNEKTKSRLKNASNGIKPIELSNLRETTEISNPTNKPDSIKEDYKQVIDSNKSATNIRRSDSIASLNSDIEILEVRTKAKPTETTTIEHPVSKPSFTDYCKLLHQSATKQSSSNSNLLKPIFAGLFKYFNKKELIEHNTAQNSNEIKQKPIDFFFNSTTRFTSSTDIEVIDLTLDDYVSNENSNQNFKPKLCKLVT